MSAEKKMEYAVDPDGKWLYRVGGISALISRHSLGLVGRLQTLQARWSIRPRCTECSKKCVM